MKTRLITILITAGAFIDTIYGVLADNSGILVELGISPKATKIVMVLGLLWTAFSKSLKDAPVQKIVASEEEIGLPKPTKP